MPPEKHHKFLCDMGVSSSVTKWLTQNGYDAAHLVDEQLQRLTDDMVFQKAVSESRIILTFDLDFGEILFHLQATQPSVIIFRLQNQTPGNVIKHLETILENYAENLTDGTVLLITEKKYRIRKLPIN